MFLRRYERRSGGRKRTYWALAESIRTKRGSRQRIVAYLGELAGSEQSGWAQLGRSLSGKQRPQPSLFDPPHYDDPSNDEPVLVDLNGIRLERLRDFGDVWMALGLWRLLGLDSLLQNAAEPGREEVPWAVVAAILTIARFCKPSSELHIETTWYRGTALEDLLGVSAEKVYTDRLYAGLDWLLPHKSQIEKHLKERLGVLFDLEYDLLLYDVTSTYFEGQCGGNGLAKRGYSRDGRPDCLQVCIGLVVTTDGVPLGYEVFAGNRHDSTTVEEIVAAMEEKYGQANRVWVMDRGMVSAKNLRFLRERKGQYIVGTPKAMLRQFEEYLTRKDWREVQEGVEVQLVPGPDGTETFILARSMDRREKEKAMHQRFVDRLEMALRKMQASAESGRLKEEAVANRRLGRLMCQYWRAAGAFDVKIERLSPPQGKVRLRIAWTRNDRWNDWAALVGGLLPLADQSPRDRSGGAVEALHPVDGSGMGVSHLERRVGNPSDMASKNRAGVGPHSGLLPGLRFMEDLGAMDAAIGPGRCAADVVGGVIEDQERRRSIANPHEGWSLQWNGSPAMCDRAGRSPESAAPPPRNPPAASPS